MKNNEKNTVEKLVEDFYRNEKELLSKSFQETEVRSRFIDPFFSALGWDFHQTNLKKQFWDVHREYSQKDNSSTKKPDYAFRVKKDNYYKAAFFVEAKAPWVNLHDQDPVYQAKRYSFSSHGKTPIVILTDFQEFRVFNGLQRPILGNPLIGLIKKFDLKYTDYLNHWDSIYSVFSKDAVQNGSIEKLVKLVDKTTKSLDDEFLNDISEWRDILARHIAIRNIDLTVDELNESVQRIIDRLVFIRNLEDRQIEPENSLLNSIKGKKNLYKQLLPLFSKLNETYNGLLYKPHFSEKLTIDDSVISDIIKKMCYPISPFRFDVIEPEILGRIYERFLGSKIRLTENHQAKVEEKPEVRHAKGVYYTPQDIVEYISKNTVGKIIQEKSPDEIKEIKVLDPACGSGSFLIGAYKYMVQYHQKWYSNASQALKNKYRDDFYINAEGDYQLSLQKKASILKSNIFGVDIDREATEVAIMSLYLTLLDEGYDKGQAELFMKGHILPDMTENVKCGNSLVGTDIYKNNLFETSEFESLRPFDWNKAFNTITSSGGFDAIVGNPPYIRVQELDHRFIDYCKKKYTLAWKRIDISILFVELAIKLLNNKGINGYITSNQFLSTEYGRMARVFLKSHAKVIRIVDFGDLPVFQNALTYVSIFLLGKGKSEKFDYLKVNKLEEDIDSIVRIEIDAAKLGEDSWILGSESKGDLISKLKKNYPHLDNYAKCWYGVITGSDKVMLITEQMKKAEKLENGSIMPLLRAQDCDRYAYSDASKYVIYPYKNVKNNTELIDLKEFELKYPNTADYLRRNKSLLVKRKDSRKEMGGTSGWHSLVRFGRIDIFNKPKIVTPGEVKRNKFGLDITGSAYSGARVFGITSENDKLDLKILLGILNSKLVEFYLHSVASLKQGGYYSYSSTVIDAIPLPHKVINTKDKDIVSLRNLVDTILSDNYKIQSIKSDTEKSLLQDKIKFLESEIDCLVYNLYDISASEIQMIEKTIQ